MKWTRKDLERALRLAQGDDGGFGPVAGATSEPEPTALAALALGDEPARAWLRSRQAADGSVGLRLGSVWNDSATALAALAFGPGKEQASALDHLQAAQAATAPNDPIIPHDPSIQGWSWTAGTFGWVEPTSRAVLALRRFRPAAPQIADGVAVLIDRECVGGGWNYGNRVVYGENLPPYAQTTAAALLALRPNDGAIVTRGLARLHTLWRDEQTGGLSLAMSLAAFRAHGDGEAAAVAKALGEVAAKTSLFGDTVALAWAVIASGPAFGEVIA